jgi:hypothetical protein
MKKFSSPYINYKAGSWTTVRIWQSQIQNSVDLLLFRNASWWKYQLQNDDESDIIIIRPIKTATTGFLIPPLLRLSLIPILKYYNSYNFKLKFKPHIGYSNEYFQANTQPHNMFFYGRLWYCHKRSSIITHRYGLILPLSVHKIYIYIYIYIYDRELKWKHVTWMLIFSHPLGNSGNNNWKILICVELRSLTL